LTIALAYSITRRARAMGALILAASQRFAGTAYPTPTLGTRRPAQIVRTNVSHRSNSCVEAARVDIGVSRRPASSMPRPVA
jgi:hypothetical protein